MGALQLQLLRQRPCGPSEGQRRVAQRSLSEPGLLTRRGFIGAGGLALAGGIVLPMASSGCSDETQEIVAELIAAAIVALTTDLTQYFVGEAVGGVISLSNETADFRRGFAEIGLVDTADNLVAGGTAPYEVPAFTVNEYRWSGLQTEFPGDLRAVAITALSRVLSELFQMIFR